MPGAIIDYFLPSNASGAITLEILDATGRLVRHFKSDDPSRTPHPALDPVAYNSVCKTSPNSADCGLPLYWPAPPVLLEATAGAHRFSWDLHYDPIGSDAPFGIGGGAVPHRTFPNVGTPWAVPGNYTVRLTVNGAQYTQPLTLKLDPRVRTSAIALAQLNTLTRDLYFGAVNANKALADAHALAAKLDGAGADGAALKASIDSLAPAAPAGGGGGGRGGGGRGGRGGGAGGDAAPTLASLAGEMMGAANAMQGADVAPTAARVEAANKALANSSAVMLRWNAIRTTRLAALNAKRKLAGQPPIAIDR
jgi:hypothetical protein